jgi:glycosyltransferase involved in cell wall biosynthesis/CelD/BcsL family acetyltransferase involved in cellulose biosynthesis
MPLVSVVMPTFNRADTILRAIASVQAQTHGDWDLIVVDDGSTDDTASRIAGLDPRIRVLRQENRGVTAARNTGLAAVRGDLVAFLDSDDEWLPHHLALAVAFFAASPGEHLFTSEFWEDFGTGDFVKHYRPEAGEFAPRVARRIGSTAFDTPPPHGDAYLWFYASRAPVGAWAHPVLEKTPFSNAIHYRGNIFRGWRWEFLMSMQSTVLTGAALAQVGPPDPRFRVASDYEWLARLCREYATNMVNAPGTIKHEYSAGKKPLLEGHLVTGKTAVQFHEDMLRIFEDLFWNDAPDDPELSGIRAYRQLKVAEAMLLAGQRRPALDHLERAVQRYRGLDARRLLWLARLLPHDALSSRAYRISRRAGALSSRVVRRGRPVRAEKTSIEVRALRSSKELESFGDRWNELNLASRRPCPFETREFLAANLTHDEFAAPGDEVLLLVAFDGDRLAGFLPLRKTTKRVAAMPYGKIECLALGYRDRPRVVARPEDEAACAAAFYRHLREQERGWDMLELASQDSDSALDGLVEAAGRGFWGRRRETEPNSTIPLPFTALPDYYASLDGDFRRKVTARCRRLLAAGRVEVIVSSEPAARGALLEMYLDVERRSWKAEGAAGIARHPERLALFRELCAGPLTVVFEVVLLDGVAIAGLAAVEFEKTWYVLESTYDAGYADLAPGYLLHLVGIGAAISRGQRAFNLLHGYPYYKLSWNGVATKTADVQIYRVPSLPYFKARAGDFKRRHMPAAEPESAQFNPARRASGEDASAKQARTRPPREDAAKHAARALSQIASACGGVPSLSGAALVASLPFPLTPARR